MLALAASGAWAQDWVIVEDPPATAPRSRPEAPDPANPEGLPALLARTLAWDPQVKLARSLLQAAEDRRGAARSRLGPIAGVSATRGRSNEIELGFPIQRTTDRSEAYIRWNLLNGGNDVAELFASDIDIAAAAAELRRAREESAESLSQAYGEVLRLDGLLPRSAARLAAVQRLVQQVQRQVEAGKVPDADSQQAQAALLDAEIVNEQLLSERDAAQRRLATLAGGPVGRTQPVALPPLATGAAAAAGLVAAAQQRALAARERVRPTASLLAPRVDFEYRQQLSDRTQPQLTTTTQHAAQVTARWELAVGGENFYRRSEGERRAEAAAAEAERAVVETQAELITMAPRIAQGERALAQLARQVERYDALVRAGELQFEAGRRSLPQLVQLQDSRFNAEQRLADQSARLFALRLRQLVLSGQLLPALGQTAD